MMTVEERAQAMVEERVNLKPWEGAEELKARFVQHLRDQIEDCAKVADGFLTSSDRLVAQMIGKRIRALAGPTEEGKESER